MKKNSLKRVFSAVAVGAVALSAAGMTTFADNLDPMDNITQAEVDASAIKPVITLDVVNPKAEDDENPFQRVYTTADAGKEVTVTVSVSGVDMKYCSTGIHLYYDEKLTLKTKKSGAPDASLGEAGDELGLNKAEADGAVDQAGFKGVFLTTGADKDLGYDGVLWNLTFILPETLEEGQVFPLDIYYRANPENENLTDLFTNMKRDSAMTAWAFSYGIYNEKYNNNFKANADDAAKCPALNNINASYDGYIAIAGGAETTTSTTTTIATTTTTTTTVESTSSTTTKKAELPDDGSKTTTSKKPASSSSSTKASTTSKSDSPKTGVTGVGVAVAGLAVALGTAFVLRKKED